MAWVSSHESIGLIQNVVLLMMSLGSGRLDQRRGAPELWVIFLWGKIGNDWNWAVTDQECALQGHRRDARAVSVALPYGTDTNLTQSQRVKNGKVGQPGSRCGAGGADSSPSKAASEWAHL